MASCCALTASALTLPAHAVSSAELYTLAQYPYGRFETRVQFAGGDGVVGSFFLWKDGSEKEATFWNELDLEALWSDCEVLSNALYGDPEASHSQSHGTNGGWCGSFHTYAYEWTPDYIAWFIDGVEVRRETDGDSTAFRDNAPDGMQIHFNVWPGDSTFGGNFNPAILPLHQYINWVQYSSYADGAFTLEWREDFGAETLPEGWLTGDWGSPKGLSTHAPANVAFMGGYAILSMTADDATGPAGAAPMDPEGAGPLVEPAPSASAVSSNPPSDPVGAGGSPAEGGAPSVPAAGSGGSPVTPTAPSPESSGTSEPSPDASTAAGGSGAAPQPIDTAGPMPSATAQTTTPATPAASGPSPGIAMTPEANGTTPNATPTTAPVSGSETPAPTLTPAVAPAPAQTVMPAASDSDASGGCRMSPRTVDGRAWIAMLLGLSAGYGCRRVRRRAIQLGGT